MNTRTTEREKVQHTPESRETEREREYTYTYIHTATIHPNTAMENAVENSRRAPNTSARNFSINTDGESCSV